MRRHIAALSLCAVLGAACSKPTPSHEGHKHDHAPAEAHDDEHRGEQHQEGEHHDEGLEIRISDVALAQNRVRVEPAPGGSVGAAVEVPAQVVPNPARVVHVTVPVPGRITAVKVALGDLVEKGGALATVESAEIGEAQSALAQARADVEVARKNYDRQRELVESGIGARRNLDEAEAALKRADAALAAAAERLRMYTGGQPFGSALVVRAPIAGRVVERHANIGEVIGSNEPLFVVADLSTVWIEGKVSEQDLAKAVVGAKATLTLQAYPGEAWEGSLSFVGPVVDPKSRTVAVRMELDNADERLKPGLFGTLALVEPAAAGEETRAVLPQDAVQRTDLGEVVFVPRDERGAFRPVPVAVGAKRHGLVEILSGVKPGEPVVVEGALLLKSEMLKGELGEGHAH